MDGRLGHTYTTIIRSNYYFVFFTESYMKLFKTDLVI